LPPLDSSSVSCETPNPDKTFFIKGSKEILVCLELQDQFLLIKTYSLSGNELKREFLKNGQFNIPVKKFTLSNDGKYLLVLTYTDSNDSMLQTYEITEVDGFAEVNNTTLSLS
jgi:hypothetical protein